MLEFFSLFDFFRECTRGKLVGKFYGTAKTKQHTKATNNFDGNKPLFI